MLEPISKDNKIGCKTEKTEWVESSNPIQSFKLKDLRTSSSWSNTFLSFFALRMPFSCANCSHLVSGRGTGHFLVRGNTNDGAGSLATTHSSTRSVGCSHNWFTISCTLSRVKSAKYCSLFFLQIGKKCECKMSEISNTGNQHVVNRTWIAFHPNHLDRNTANTPNRFSLRDAC